MKNFHIFSMLLINLSNILIKFCVEELYEENTVDSYNDWLWNWDTLEPFWSCKKTIGKVHEVFMWASNKFMTVSSKITKWQEDVNIN